MATTRYATGQDWYIEAPKPAGGFVLLHHDRVLAVWDALLEQKLQLRDVRVWLACHELKARRCQTGENRKPEYCLDELHSLVGGTGGQHLRASMQRLKKSGLLLYSPQELSTSPGNAQKGRLIPMPRRVLRMLSKARGRAFIAAVLGHAMRCLFYRRGICRSGGWCKASWIAETFGVAIRAVKEARQKLVGMGLIELLEADQLRLNRMGKPLVIRLAWGGESAPRAAQSTTESAPLTKHKKLSYRRSEHQKPARPADAAGVCKQTNEPDLNNIIKADLEDPWRLATLFKQARLRGWVRKTHHDILNVFAAAQHALRIGVSNPCGLFVYIIRRGYWDVISQADEDAGRRAVLSLRNG
jgi:hypothetical protein